MSTFKLHCFAESGNCYKVALYLNCAGLQWTPVPVDFFSGETRQDEWRQTTNTMGEAPTLEVDGRILSQSGAILSYLAEETRKYAGRDENERYEILRWILFDNHKFTNHLATYRWLYSMSDEPADEAVMTFLKTRAENAFDLVDQHLSKQSFIVGEHPTIADFSLSGYLYFPAEQHGFDFESDYPNISAWTNRIRGLPGWAAPAELMPSGHRKA